MQLNNHPTLQYSLRADGGLIHKPEYHAAGGIGGIHPGRPKGTDTVPAWLTPGEFVQNRGAVRYYGQDFMNAVNDKRFPRYLADGGTSIARALSGLNLGGGGNNGMPVSLSAGTLHALARILKTEIFVDGNVLASSVNNSNRMSTSLGRG